MTNLLSTTPIRLQMPPRVFIEISEVPVALGLTIGRVEPPNLVENIWWRAYFEQHQPAPGELQKMEKKKKKKKVVEQVEDMTPKTSYERVITNIEDTQFLLRGHVPLILHDGHTVAEKCVKRREKLNQGPYRYEASFLQGCLHVLPASLGVTHALFVESLGTESNSCMIEKNEAYWAEVMEPALVKLCNKAHKLLKKKR